MQSTTLWDIWGHSYDLTFLCGTYSAACRLSASSSPLVLEVCRSRDGACLRREIGASECPGSAGSINITRDRFLPVWEHFNLGIDLQPFILWAKQDNTQYTVRSTRAVGGGSTDVEVHSRTLSPQDYKDAAAETSFHLLWMTNSSRLWWFWGRQKPGDLLPGLFIMDIRDKDTVLSPVQFWLIVLGLTVVVGLLIFWSLRRKQRKPKQLPPVVATAAEEAPPPPEVLNGQPPSELNPTKQ